MLTRYAFNFTMRVKQHYHLDALNLHDSDNRAATSITRIPNN